MIHYLTFLYFINANRGENYFIVNGFNLARGLTSLSLIISIILIMCKVEKLINIKS